MQLLLIGTALRSSNLTYMRATAVSNLTKWTSEIVLIALELTLVVLELRTRIHVFFEKVSI